MNKIIKLFTAALMLTMLLFTSGCKKDGSSPADTKSWCIITQDGAVVQTYADSLSKDFGLSILHVKIKIFNDPGINPGYLELYFVNINGPDFSVNASPTSKPFQIGNSDLLGINYANYFIESDGNPSQKSFKTFSTSNATSATSASLTITKNDLVGRRIEGTINNCVLYDAVHKNSTTINCSFWISY